MNRILMIAGLSAMLAGCATEIYAPPRYVAPVPVTPQYDATYIPRVERGTRTQEQFELHLGVCRQGAVAQLNLQGVQLAYSPGLASKETGDQIYQRWLNYCMQRHGYAPTPG